MTTTGGAGGTTDTRKRVKLYALNAERQWDDRGTGHVSSTYVDRLKGISLLVRAEADGERILYCTIVYYSNLESLGNLLIQGWNVKVSLTGSYYNALVLSYHVIVLVSSPTFGAQPFTDSVGKKSHGVM